MKKVIFILGITLFCSCAVKKYCEFAVIHNPDCKYCYNKFD